MIAVKVRSNEPFEKAFKRFNKACERSGLMSDIRSHQHYEKPSDERKRREKEARRNMQRLMRHSNF